MKIIKRINHNAALALDGQGHELVVLGKGVGFPTVPYELTDMSQVVKTFYDVEPRYLDMIASISQEMLIASADIVEQAEINLDCDLNPNITFTLADHLKFAMERIEKGIVFFTPLAYDVAHLYPKEYELGLLALDVVEDYVHVRLPKSEAVNVAMHIINGELENGDVHSVLTTMKVIQEIERLIEDELQIVLDKESFQYSRLTMHLRYLIERLTTGKQLQDGLSGMLEGLVFQHLEVYRCAERISQYLKEKWSWECTRDEVLYLMVHINRVKEKTNS